MTFYALSGVPAFPYALHPEDAAKVIEDNCGFCTLTMKTVDAGQNEHITRIDVYKTLEDANIAAEYRNRKLKKI